MLVHMYLGCYRYLQDLELVCAVAERNYKFSFEAAAPL